MFFQNRGSRSPSARDHYSPPPSHPAHLKVPTTNPSCRENHHRGAKSTAHHHNLPGNQSPTNCRVPGTLYTTPKIVAYRIMPELGAMPTIVSTTACHPGQSGQAALPQLIGLAQLRYVPHPHHPEQANIPSPHRTLFALPLQQMAADPLLVTTGPALPDPTRAGHSRTGVTTQPRAR